MLLKKRLFAFFIDYFIILIYGTVLWIASSLSFKYLKIPIENFHPAYSQLIGFVSLTLPVFCYFFLLENGSQRATIGKRKLNIYIDASDSKGKNGVFLRNLCKFLPWEIAHTGVHWVVYHSNQNNQPPAWVWMVLILPQVIVIIYLTSIFYYKGERSLYDWLAGTRVKIKNE